MKTLILKKLNSIENMLEKEQKKGPIQHGPFFYLVHLAQARAFRAAARFLVLQFLQRLLLQLHSFLSWFAAGAVTAGLFALRPHTPFTHSADAKAGTNSNNISSFFIIFPLIKKSY
jgi:hypothetical protein